MQRCSMIAAAAMAASVMPLSAHAQFESMTCTVVAPTSDQMILPHTENVEGETSTSLSLTLAPDEYEPTSFVLRPEQGLAGLRLVATDLVGPDSVIPARHVDVKYVKCWYQSEDAWTGLEVRDRKPTLVPELLLNDLALVRVDREQKRNYLKMHREGGLEYVWIDPPRRLGEEPRDVIRQTMFPLNEEFPVWDAKVLQPADLPAGENQQVWVTVHAPPNARAGDYTGGIRLVSDAGDHGSIAINVRVLPFTLANPSLDYSSYYDAELVDDHEAQVSSYFRSATQIEAELRNMLAHGIRNPILSHPLSEGDTFRRYLDLRRKVGMAGQPLYCHHLTDQTAQHNQGEQAAFTTPEEISTYVNRIADAKAIAEEYGVTDFYIYGIDEAKGKKLQSQIEVWKALQARGIKTFVAGYRDTFDQVGDALNLLICAHEPSEEEAAKFHSVGNRIHVYANPQTGPENPAVYRRNYGLGLWRTSYDGATIFTYYHSFASPWNDYDHRRWREHSLVYPTVDGVIDTIAWEGLREAIDDVRYASTLEHAIKQAEKHGSAKRRAIAREAQQFLSSLKAELPTDLESVRAKTIDWLVALHEASVAEAGPPPSRRRTPWWMQ